ncbi:hypothetical protein AURDEDRAFT_63241, partial [Auricularia subglabra TFB-10046 SS5]
LRSHICAALVDKAGEVHVAETRTQEIVGVAVWFGPGTTYLRTEAQRKAGWNQLYAQLEPIYQDWWDYFLPFYDQYTAGAFGDGVKLNGYHLQVIGVIPVRQGQGVASSFFRVVEKKVSGSLVDRDPKVYTEMCRRRLVAFAPAWKLLGKAWSVAY